MKRKWKLIFGAAIIVIILGLFLSDKGKSLEVDVLEVQPRTIAKTFVEDGEVVSEVQHPIYALYGGKVKDLPVEEGQRVEEGDLLAKLDVKELEFQLSQLQAQLKSLRGEEEQAYQEPYESTVKSQQLQVEQAKRDLEAAQKNLERAGELYQVGILTESEYEEAQNTAEAAKNNLQQQKEALSLLDETRNPTSGAREYYAGMKEAFKAQIDLLEYKISNSTIISPQDGIVSNLTVKEGQIINPGSPVMTVFQKDTYEVQVYVLTEDIYYLEPGQKVELIQETQAEDRRFPGIVKKIAPAAVEVTSALGLEEKRVKVTIEPEAPASLELRPGYALDVQFTVAKQENKLVVPKTTLFPYEEGQALWVVQDGKAQIQFVTEGFENDRDVVIEEGLKQGDLVILNPQLKGLTDGDKVIGVKK